MFRKLKVRFLKGFSLYVDRTFPNIVQSSAIFRRFERFEVLFLLEQTEPKSSMFDFSKFRGFKVRIIQITEIYINKKKLHFFKSRIAHCVTETASKPNTRTLSI